MFPNAALTEAQAQRLLEEDAVKQEAWRNSPEGQAVIQRLIGAVAIDTE